jgi:hypothetical protein
VRPDLLLETVIETVDAEGRNDVFLEVLVLVVGDDDDEVRLEVVDHRALLAEVRPHPLAVTRRRRQALVIADLLDHAGRPVGAILPLFIDQRRVDEELPERAQACIVGREARIVGRADAENLTHCIRSRRFFSLRGHR